MGVILGVIFFSFFDYDYVHVIGVLIRFVDNKANKKYITCLRNLITVFCFRFICTIQLDHFMTLTDESLVSLCVLLIHKPHTQVC